MSALRKFGLLVAALLLPAGILLAGSYSDTVTLFKNAGQSAAYFTDSYGYAVFPTIGKGGLIVGAAHGTGRVYEKGKFIGTTSVNQLSVGAQAGGQAYSQIVFFADKRALEEFTSGQFSFDAGMGAVAITAAASGEVSGGKKDAATAGKYYKGMAVFTIVKGGAMYEATVAGQKFSFKPRENT
jgi:lipid-binding SYLF domain-containing protein